LRLEATHLGYLPDVDARQAVKHLRTKEAAKLLSDLEGRGNLRAYYAGQLRDLVQRGIVIPAGHTGQGQRAALFGKTELCVEVLMGTLLRLGLRSTQIEAAAGYLDKAYDHRGRSAPGLRRVRGIPEAVKSGCLAGVPWWFVVTVEAAPRGVAAGDEVKAGGFYEAEPDEAHPYAVRFPAGAQIRDEWLPIVAVPVTKLFAPILARSDVADGPVDAADPEPVEAPG
jgi:hypothetical protein